jgi:competence protein ComFC
LKTFLDTVWASVRHWWNCFLNLLYPTPCSCIVCEESLSEEILQRMGLTEIPESRYWICSRCRSQVEHIVHVDCVVCGKVYEESIYESPSHRSQVCTECQAHQRPFEIARAAIRYKGMGKDLIRIVKYECRKEPLEWLGEWLCQAWVLHLAQIPFDYIVPVPIHPERLRQRGFNQALLLAETVSRYASIPILEPLRRTGSLRSQVTRTRQERLQTLHGVYQGIDSFRETLRDKRVLLIDDVFTTGATVEACTNELMKLGCANVWVLTLAR